MHLWNLVKFYSYTTAKKSYQNIKNWEYNGSYYLDLLQKFKKQKDTTKGGFIERIQQNVFVLFKLLQITNHKAKK